MFRKYSTMLPTFGSRALLTPVATALFLALAYGAAAGQALNADASKPAATPATTPAASLSTPATNPSAVTAAPTPAVPSLDKVRVKEVYRLGYRDSSDSETRSSAGIGDIIVVKVEDLKSLANYAKCLTAQDQPATAGCQKQDLALYLDGREIKGIQPESGAPLPDDQTLQFHLNRGDESDEAWADLLGAPPPFNKKFFLRPTAVSVGLKNGYALPTDVEGNAFRLVRIRYIRFFLCLIGTIILTGLLLYYARKTDLLRDGGAPPAADGTRSFSLGRFQMAFWFYLVIVSFVFIWTITGALDIITAQVLALIGIGAGTALGAAAIDVGKGAEASTGKFLRDILRDPETNTVSFHRFQVFVWTLVLGIIFIYSVWSRLSMPNFDATLIALMGISAGTYLGFKIPETKT